MITPQEFVAVLKRTTLSQEEQRAILKLIPAFTRTQLEELAATLNVDARALDRIFEDAERRNEELTLRFNMEAERHFSTLSIKDQA